DGRAWLSLRGAFVSRSGPRRTVRSPIPPRSAERRTRRTPLSRPRVSRSRSRSRCRGPPVTASPPPPREPFLARIIAAFLRGDLVLLLVALSMAAGVFALTATPREEEPQIVVPIADVLVRAPGLPPEEVERQIT